MTAWDVWLFFADGDSARVGEPHRRRPTNDYGDLASVKVTATLKNVRPDRNIGTAASRTFEWRYSPRNLAYERNQ